MRLGSSVLPRFKRNCTKCGNEFLGRQHNSIYCDSCKLSKQVLCKCGCGTLTFSTYAVGCFSRGKTYKEIYGDRVITNGFKKGELNPNYYLDNISSFKLNKTNSIGQKFRSELEVQFSELLLQNSIEYKYEVRYPLLNNQLKIVDFIIPTQDDGLPILVEITGYAHKSWRDDFDNKLLLLRQSYPRHLILLLTYTEFLSDLLKNNRYTDIFLDSVSNSDSILKKISLFRQITFINQLIIKQDICK